VKEQVSFLTLRWTPVKLIFRRPTEREKRDLFLHAPSDALDNLKAVEFQDRVLRTMLMEIENWEGISDADSFIDYAETEFYAEASEFALGLLTLSSDEVKNSKGSSGSINQTTRQQSGNTTPQPPKVEPEAAAMEA